MEDSNRLLGPLYFLAFIIFVFIILVNMFLAIINDSYHAVREDIELKGNKIETRECVAAFCCCMNSNNNNDRNIKVAPTVDDVHIDPSEVRDFLKGYHFTEIEIETFFARFDVDEDDSLNADEGQKLLSDLQTNNYRKKNEKPYTDPTIEPKTDYVDHKNVKDMARVEAEEIKERLGVIESAVVELYPKLDSVLGRTAEKYDEIKRQKLAERDIKQSKHEYF